MIKLLILFSSFLNTFSIITNEDVIQNYCPLCNATAQQKIQQVQIAAKEINEELNNAFNVLSQQLGIQNDLLTGLENADLSTPNYDAMNNITALAVETEKFSFQLVQILEALETNSLTSVHISMEAISLAEEQAQLIIKCFPNPCDNGGSCILSDYTEAGFQCNCPNGFSGT